MERDPLPPDRQAARRPAVPALRRGLQALQFLASRATPVSATAVARELGIARSSAYELLSELAAAGFVSHLGEARRWGLGVAAFEIGSAYLRGQPLELLGTPVVRRLAHTSAQPAVAGSPRGRGGSGDGGVEGGVTAHLGVLHGAQMLYLVKERSGGHGPTLVTDVGVRLPAALTATGLSLLAGLPAQQVRALFPDRDAFVDRTGRGPRTLPELRTELAAVGQRGWAVEDGRVSAGTASVAAAAVDHEGRPLAAVGLTVRHLCVTDSCDGLAAVQPYVADVLDAAARLTAAIGGRGRSVRLGRTPQARSAQARSVQARPPQARSPRAQSSTP
ncbi:IclR family transcriptional regulator [Nakamurella sp. A5-74]|uniref:IclR family transcriptional regulator n=1 Tax=Nakamurella sp. A5-74 TaxID=3158264 RepID=A0AAU8DLT8_9ACTN